MLNKIKREHLVIFFVLVGSLIFFDLTGVDYSGITGAQPVDVNVRGIQQAFETIFRVMFEGFAKPLFDVFHIPVTGIVAIRIFLGLFLFAILVPSVLKLNLGRDDREKKRLAAIISLLISILTAAFIPEPILNLYFGGEINIFSTLLAFVFVIGTSLLLMYGVSKIPEQDPQNNRGRSVAAGIGYLLVLFIILYITQVTRKQIASGLLTVFDITWAILVLVCMIQFFRYTFYYPLAGLGGVGTPGGQPAPQQIQHRGDLRNVIQRYIQEQQRFLNALGANINNHPEVRAQIRAILDNMNNEQRDVNAVVANILGQMNPQDRVRTETALNLINQINRDIRDALSDLNREHRRLHANRGLPAAFTNIENLFNRKRQEVNRV